MLQTLVLSNSCFGKSKQEEIPDLADYYMDRTKYDSAIIYYHKALKTDTILDDVNLKSEILANIGFAYSFKSQYDSAYKYCYRALKLSSVTGNVTQLAFLYNVIGAFYYDCENYDEAMRHFQQSYQLYCEIEDSTGMAQLENNLGEIFRLTGNYNQAKSYYLKAIEMNKILKNLNWLAINHNNLGINQIHLDDTINALRHLQNAKDIAEKNQFDPTTNKVYNSLGQFYLLISQFDSAKYYYEKAYSTSVSKRDIFQIKENADGLSSVYYKMGEYQKAFDYHQIFAYYSDSILNNKNVTKMGLLFMQSQFENEKYRQRILQDRKELRYTIIVVSLISVLLISFLIFMNQRNKTRHSKLKVKHLKLEKKYLNNELTNFALHISEKNNLLSELQDDLKVFKNVTEGQSNKKISDLKMKLDVSLSNTTDAQLLQQKADELHRDFVMRIKAMFPALTKNDIQLCSLIKLNLSTKEIAAIKQVSPQAVKVGRYRLRKKLELASEENISEYLNQLG